MLSLSVLPSRWGCAIALCNATSSTPSMNRMLLFNDPKSQNWEALSVIALIALLCRAVPT